jgi:hypothetical protein
MNTLKLVVPLSDLYLSKGKHPNIHGTIFFEINDFKFPDAQWDDFVVVILGWWIKSLYEAHQSGESQTKLSFMDGPLEVSVKLGNNISQLKFVRRRGETNEVIGKATIDYDELMSKLIDIAQKIIAKAEQNKWETTDLETLKKLMKLSQDGLK